MSFFCPIGPEIDAGALPQRVIGDVVSAGRVAGVESGESGFGAGRTPESEDLAVVDIATALGDDADDAAGASTVLCGKAVGENRHLIDGDNGNIGEDRLPSPAVDCVGAIHFKPGLPAAGAVGREQVLIHEDVSLIDGRAIGGAEKREVSDPAVVKRSFLNLGRIQKDAELRLISSDLSDRSCYGEFGANARHGKLHFDGGGGTTGQCDVVDLGGSKVFLRGGRVVGTCDWERAEIEIAGCIGPGDVLKAGQLIDDRDLRVGNTCVRLVNNAAAQSRGVWSLRKQTQGAAEEEDGEQRGKLKHGSPNFCSGNGCAFYLSSGVLTQVVD